MGSLSRARYHRGDISCIGSFPPPRSIDPVPACGAHLAPTMRRVLAPGVVATGRAVPGPRGSVGGAGLAVPLAMLCVHDNLHRAAGAPRVFPIPSFATKPSDSIVRT